MVSLSNHEVRAHSQAPLHRLWRSPSPVVTGEDPLWHDLSVILPRLRGRGTMRSMVEGAHPCGSCPSPATA